jgi:glyoxylase-like metal-dependent hydrolase (beta-lactamase superfamily II)
MVRMAARVSGHRTARSTGRTLAWLAVATAAGVMAFGGDGASWSAQAPGNRGGQTELETLRVQGNVHVITGAGANITVQTGPQGVVVVDTGLPQHTERVLAAIRRLSPRSIRFVVNTHAHPEHAGANAQLAAAGMRVSGRGVAVVGAGQTNRAEILAHELVLHRMSGTSGESATPAEAWPTTTYAYPTKEFFTNGEGIQLVHQASAHTDGDSFVFFRRSDVIAAGDVYSTESYPIIDVERGGSIQGVLDGLNRLLALVIAGEKTEGGTMIVPGHGRISDEADLVEYRDMVTIIRDRVQDMIKKGMTLEQVTKANPTFEYDGLYASARGWSREQFVEAVYRGLGGK